jgi:hypothetical protein
VRGGMLEKHPRDKAHAPNKELGDEAHRDVGSSRGGERRPTRWHSSAVRGAGSGRRWSNAAPAAWRGHERGKALPNLEFEGSGAVLTEAMAGIGSLVESDKGSGGLALGPTRRAHRREREGVEASERRRTLGERKLEKGASAAF